MTWKLQHGIAIHLQRLREVTTITVPLPLARSKHAKVDGDKDARAPNHPGRLSAACEGGLRLENGKFPQM